MEVIWDKLLKKQEEEESNLMEDIDMKEEEKFDEEFKNSLDQSYI